TIVLAPERRDAKEILATIVNMPIFEEAQDNLCTFNEKRTTFSTIIDELEKKNQESFDLDVCEYHFELAHIAKYKFKFLLIRHSGLPICEWNKWVTPWMNGSDFVMAWIADSQYQYWQNAHDPLQYSAVGRSYQHLPMKSNRLPPPLEMMIIDTSNN